MFPSQTLPFEARALVREASWWESLCLELPPPPAPACREFSFSALEEELAAPSPQPKEQRSPVVLQKIVLCLRRAPVWPPAAPSQLSSLLASCLLDPELGQQAGKCPLWTGGLWTHLVFPHSTVSILLRASLLLTSSGPTVRFMGSEWDGSELG